ncbi:hypothetical protein C8F01DRAFT_1373649 [Mycena amicta]|nr:hypothetical protein C8F01DRAFT_1373649 [Mycena amicta]
MQHSMSYRDVNLSGPRKTERRPFPPILDIRSKMVLSKMGDRVRQLEAAFKELGMKESPTGNMCASVNALLSANVAISPAMVVEEKRQALGSLRVDEKGNAKYFGPMGCSEALLSVRFNPIPFFRSQLIASMQLDNRDSLPSSRPNDSICPFSAITSTFTIHSESSPRWDAAQAREYLHKHLPLEDRGLALCAIFFQNGCWNVSPLMKDEAAQLLHEVYLPAPTIPITTQHLAVTYIIFALGALVDVALPPFSDQAKGYFELARAAMSVKSLFDNPGVLSVQALMMIAAYYGHSGPQFSMDAAWSMISLALNILQTLGLHRASTYSDTRFSLVDALFWEVYSLATLFGQSLGRPTGLFVASVSCPFPPDDEDAEPPFVRIQCGFRSSLWRLTRDVITHTHEAFLTADRPSYDAILDLDERIRRYRLWVPAFDDPEYLIPNPDAPPEDSDPHAVSAYLQRMSRPLVCKMLTMLIHKSSFVEALRESTSPIQSSYAASFLAAYRAASEIIKCQTKNMEVSPILFLRCRSDAWSIGGRSQRLWPTGCVSEMAQALEPRTDEELDIVGGYTRVVGSGSQVHDFAHGSWLAPAMSDFKLHRVPEVGSGDLTPSPLADGHGEVDLDLDLNLTAFDMTLQQLEYLQTHTAMATGVDIGYVSRIWVTMGGCTRTKSGFE